MPTARAGSLGAALVLIAAALFGSLGVFARIAYAEGMEPFAFVAWRSAVGAIGLWVAVALLRRPTGIRAGFRGIGQTGRRWLALAIVLGAGLNLAAFLSFDYTTVALALLAFYTYPAMVAAGSVLLGREPLDANRVLALALALGGMVAVVLGGPNDGTAARGPWLGIAFALAAAGFQTVFVLTSRGYSGLAAEHAMGTILTGTALVAIPISLVANGSAALAMPLGSPGLLALLLVVGLFAAALPSVLFLTGIRWIGGVRTGILMLFEPVVGVALAAAVLAEGLQPVQFVGGALILLAAVVVQRGTPAKAETPAIAPAPGGP